MEGLSDLSEISTKRFQPKSICLLIASMQTRFLCGMTLLTSAREGGSCRWPGRVASEEGADYGQAVSPPAVCLGHSGGLLEHFNGSAHQSLEAHATDGFRRSFSPKLPFWGGRGCRSPAGPCLSLLLLPEINPRAVSLFSFPCYLRVSARNG